MAFLLQQRASLFLIMGMILMSTYFTESFVLGPANEKCISYPFGRSSVTALASTPFSAPGGSKGNGDENSRKPKKSVRDRTQEEAISLIRDIIQAAVDAGPQAGPVRTFQAYRAFTETIREFVPRFGQPNPPAFSAPKAIRTLFEKLGATYVKLGQVRCDS